MSSTGTKDHVLAQATGKDVPASGTALLIPVPKHAASKMQVQGAAVNRPLRSLDPVALQKAKTAANDLAAASQRAIQPVLPPAAARPYGVSNGANFSGISASGCCTPSDSTGAIGPTQYVEMVNTAIAVRPRGGTFGAPVDLATFGGNVSPDCTADPQISWDQQAGRWLYSFLELSPSCASPTTNYLDVGWSKTSDASDLLNGWCHFALNTGQFAFDYDKLGHDNNFISIGANVFDLTQPATNPPVTAVIMAIPKPARGDTSCTVPATATFFGSPTSPLRNADSSLAFTPVPADTTDGSPFGYIVAAHDPGIGTANKVMVWHLSSNAGTPILTADGEVAVAAYALPPAIPQPATGATACSATGNCLDSLDARLTQAVAHFDPAAGTETIWTQHAVTDAAVGTLSLERWYELVPGQGGPRQSGNISDSSLYIFNGAISPSLAGNEAVIFYNAGNSSVSGFASIRARSRDASTPLGMFASETIIASSTVNDNDHSCGVNVMPTNLTLPCRWGDYAAARPDPLDANTVWGTSMLTGTGGTSNSAGWATQVAAFTLGCASITASAAPPSPSLSNTAVTFTGSASGCTNPNPLYQFWILTPGSSTWTVAQAYSTSATFNWSTTGPLPIGTYHFSVWVRDATSAGTSCSSLGCYDAFASTTYTLTSTPCTALTASAAPPSPSLPGTAVTFTASASGCPNPLYQFWTLAPGGSWTVVQPYSNSATFNWTTTGLTAGIYHYSVWVRDASSAATYDAYFAGTAYTLTPTTCTSVTASAAPPSPSLPGTAVTFTAIPSGCTNPRYQFWTLAPGGSWTVAQPYSSGATFNWTTTGLPAGIYHFSVWVRDASSASSYDAYFPGTAYTLTSTACTSLTVSAAPPSMQTAGTAVTFTAGASGCPNPRYQFWILAPGGSWTVAQPYSSNAMFNWTTTGLPAGTYHYSVWVRDASSAGSYDTFFPGTAYTLTSTPCTSVTASAAPASPSPHGTAITITASTSGCPNARYQFWILAPGGSWTIAQAYSTSAAFNWTTTGLPAGTYRYSVWVRNASSAAGYDAYVPGTPYTLT